MSNKTFNNVKLNLTLKTQSTRANLLSTSEDLAVQMGKIQKWYTDFAWSAWTAPTVTVTGSGNAVTSASYGTGANANKLTLTLGATFLTQHPPISVTTDTTSTDSPAFGSTFTAVDSVTRDANGHVTTLNTKTITVPNKTMGAATSSAAGSIGLVPAPAAGEQASFLRGDGTWAIPTNTPYTAGTGLVLSGMTFNHSNSVTAVTTASLLKFTYDAQGHITSSSAATSSDLPSHTHFEGDVLMNKDDTFRSSAGIPIVSAPFINTHRANKFAFMKSDDIQIEYTTDGGTTWNDGGYTAADKASLFIMRQTAVIKVGPNTSDNRTTQMQTRITLTFTDRDAFICKLYIWFGTNGHQTRLDIEYANASDPSTFIMDKENALIDGWSGGNIVNISNLRLKTNVSKIRLTFRTTSVNTNTSYINKPSVIYDIQAFGRQGIWTAANSMMGYDHLYSWDVDKNATFPAEVKAKVQMRVINSNYGFLIRNDDTNTHMLLTNSGEAESGSWNTLRPFYITNATGKVTMKNGVQIDTGANYYLTLNGTATASMEYNASNPRIRFSNGTTGSALQTIELGFTDYDSIQAPASLYLTGNQGGEYFISPNIRIDSNATAGAAGNLTFKDPENVGACIRYKPAILKSGYSGIIIDMRPSGDQYGCGLVFGRGHGGLTIVGGGESANGLCNVIENSLNPWGSSALGYDAENLYNISDTSIYFISGANGLSTSAYTDWTDIKTALFDNNGYFRPSKDKNGQIGASNYRWNYGYFGTVDANTANITNSAFGPLTITRSSAYGAGIVFKNSNGSLGSIGMTGSADGGLMRWSASGASTYTVCDTGNTSITQVLSSGTKIATIKIAGTNTDLYCQTNKYAFIIDNSENVASAPWHKFAEATLTANNDDLDICFYVSKLYLSNNSKGILNAHVRTGSNCTLDANSTRLQWLVVGSEDTTGMLLDNFVMVCIQNSGSVKVELWVKIPARWISYVFKVLTECNRQGVVDSVSTVVMTASAAGTAAYTSGGTNFVSTTGSLQNTAASLSTDAGSNVTPVYFSGGIPVAVNKPASGAWFSTVPSVGSTGVIDIGRYIDFHSTNAGTTDYDVRLDASSTSLLTLSSNSGTPTFRISGTLPRLNFKQTTSGSAYENANCGITAYPAGNTSGVNLVIQSAGNTYIGGGESVTAMYTAVKTSGANPYTNLTRSVDSGGTASSITPAIGNEKMFITSDEQIFFAVGANGLSTSAHTDWTNLKTVLLDSDGFFRPSINNKGQIGTSDYKWKAVHATEVVGNAVGKDGFIAYPEDGTFSEFNPSVSINCITITLPIDLSAITVDNYFKVGFKVDMWSYAEYPNTSDTLTIAGLIGNYDSTLKWLTATAVSNCYPFTVSFGFLNSKAQINILVQQNAFPLYAPEIRIRDIVVSDTSGNHNTFAENKSGWIIESNSDVPAGYEASGYILNSSLTSQPGLMLWSDLIYSKAVINPNGLLYAGKQVGFCSTSNAVTPNYILDYAATNTVTAYAFNGKYTVFNIKSQDYARLSFQTTKSGKTYTADGIIMYPLANSGMTALFSCGGNMVIGGGEFATNAYARKNSSNTTQVGYDNIVTTEREKLYLGADTEVQIISNAGSIGTYNNNNHKVWKFQTDGMLITPGSIKDSLDNQHTMIQQNLKSTSNCVALTWWIVDGAASATTRPGIYYYNTGGDSTDKGAIILQPYHSSSNPWDSGQPIGLYIGKGILKLDGTNVALQNATSLNTMINALSTGTSTPSDNDYYISQYAGGGTSTTTYHRRPVSALYSYIYGKLQHDNAMNTAHTFAEWNSVGWHRVLSLPCSASASGRIIRTIELTCIRNYNNGQPEVFSVRMIGLYNATEGFEILYSKSNTAATQYIPKIRMTKSSDGKTLYVDFYYNTTANNAMTVYCTWLDPDITTRGTYSITWGNGAVVDNSLTVVASLDIPRDITAPGTGFYYVIGTQTASTAAWTGTIPASKLHNGLTIAYYLPYASAASTNVTLNLTLSTGATTGAINVYYTGASRMTTHYGAGSTIILTYFEAGAISVSGTATTDARWTHSDYNTNTNNAVTQSNSTTENYRALMLGYNNSATPSDLTATVTQQTYASENLYAQPSTGLIACNGRKLITPFAIQTGSSKRQKITLQTLMSWLITTKKYIHSGIYEHVVLQTTWAYADNDILRLAVNGINYEMDLAGVRIEYIGQATSYNAGAFTLKIISNPAPNFTATSGYTKFPPSTIAFYTCNGPQYNPVWRMIMNGACGQPKIFESTDNLSVLPMPIEVTGLFTNWKFLLAQCTRLIYGGGTECSSFQAIIPLEYLKSLGTSGEMHIPLPFTIDNNPEGRNYMILKYVNDNKFTIGYHNNGIDTISGRGLWTMYGMY